MWSQLFRNASELLLRAVSPFPLSEEHHFFPENNPGLLIVGIAIVEIGAPNLRAGASDERSPNSPADLNHHEHQTKEGVCWFRSPNITESLPHAGG